MWIFVLLFKDADQFKVTFSSGEKRLCRIIGLDELNDIAVLKVEGSDFKSMMPVNFDRSGMIPGWLLLSFPQCQNVQACNCEFLSELEICCPLY